MIVDIERKEKKSRMYIGNMIVRNTPRRRLYTVLYGIRELVHSLILTVCPFLTSILGPFPFPNPTTPLTFHLSSSLILPRLLSLCLSSIQCRRSSHLFLRVLCAFNLPGGRQMFAPLPLDRTTYLSASSSFYGSLARSYTLCIYLYVYMMDRIVLVQRNSYIYIYIYVTSRASTRPALTHPHPGTTQRAFHPTDVHVRESIPFIRIGMLAQIYICIFFRPSKYGHVRGNVFVWMRSFLYTFTLSAIKHDGPPSEILSCSFFTAPLFFSSPMYRHVLTASVSAPFSLSIHDKG